MTDSSRKVLEAAMALSERERADLAARLLESLGSDSEAEVEIAWREEIERRAREVEEGAVELEDWDSVRARLYVDLRARLYVDLRHG